MILSIRVRRKPTWSLVISASVLSWDNKWKLYLQNSLYHPVSKVFAQHFVRWNARKQVFTSQTTAYDWKRAKCKQKVNTLIFSTVTNLICIYQMHLLSRFLCFHQDYIFLSFLVYCWNVANPRSRQQIIAIHFQTNFWNGEKETESLKGCCQGFFVGKWKCLKHSHK